MRSQVHCKESKEKNKDSLKIRSLSNRCGGRGRGQGRGRGRNEEEEEEVNEKE